MRILRHPTEMYEDCPGIIGVPLEDNSRFIEAVGSLPVLQKRTFSEVQIRPREAWGWDTLQVVEKKRRKWVHNATAAKSYARKRCLRQEARAGARHIWPSHADSLASSETGKKTCGGICQQYNSSRQRRPRKPTGLRWLRVVETIPIEALKGPQRSLGNPNVSAGPIAPPEPSDMN